MYKTKGEVGACLQGFANVGEDAAGNQCSCEFHGVNLEVVQILHAEQIHRIVEAVAGINPTQHLRLVVVYLAAFASLENGVVGIIHRA